MPAVVSFETKPKFIRDKSFYKLLLTIALPVTLQNVVIFFTQMLDTVMLGELGEVAMSASSLANQPFFIFNMLTFGMGSGAAVLTSQYWGMRKTEPIRRIFSMIIRFSILFGVLLTAVVFLIPEQVMSLFTPDAAVIEAGADYLRIIGWCYLFYGFTNVYYTALRSVEAVKVAMLSNLIALFVNAGLNYVLIFGKLGAPAMGVKGAAIATLVARLVEFGIGVCYMFFVDRKLKIRLRDFFRFDPVLFRDLLTISIPVIANELMWALAMSVQAGLLGQLGTNAVSANSIISVIQQLSTVAVFGIANASAVLIGKAIGEGNMQEARNRGFTFKWLSVLIGFLVSGIILLLQGIAVDFYNVTDETKALAHDMIYVAAVIGFFVSIAAVGIVGVLRGGGDTRFCLGIEMLALWGVAVPLAYFTAFVLHWPVVAVFFCMKIDEPVKALLYLIRVRGTKWLRSVTRVFSESGETPAGQIKGGD